MARKLGDTLKSLREKKGVTNADLAKAAGIDESTVGQILAGEIMRPPNERLRGLAKLLDVSFEHLIEQIPADLREADSDFLEAPAGGRPLRFMVRVIRAGLSKNRNYYPDAVLREAAPRFANARVFVKADAEHLSGGGRSFNQLIGRLTEPRFVEGQGRDAGQIQAVLEVLESAGEVGAKLREAFERGMSSLFGFSIDAKGEAKRERGRRVAKSISQVDSVDLIIEPSAGGELINLIEALDQEEQREMKLRERMIEAIKKANGGKLPDALDTDDEEALEIAYREALAPSDTDTDDDEKQRRGAGGGSDPASGAGGGVTEDYVNERVRMVEARATARAKIAACGLPDPAKERLQRHFDGLETFTEAAVDQAIADERKYLARFAESGRVVDLGDTSYVESGADRPDKIAQMLDAFFDRGNRDVQSFKECYVEITGDRRVTGQLSSCDARRLREAVGEAEFRESIDSTTFSKVLGDAITRALVRDYRTPSRYDVYRSLVDVVPLNDVRTQHRTRYGGYGDLPTVGQGAPYGPLTSPTDEEATYAPAKRGGTEDLTLEAVKNDDVGLVRRIPTSLSRSARRTLSKFVLDFIKDNPAIYDGDALFHANHNNLGSSALDATTLAAARLAMMKQAEKDSGDRLGIPPSNLLVGPDLEETGFDLFRRQTNNDTDFVESLQMNVLPVWYWTDANDWAVTADITDIPFIELGFVDGNEEPELFVQDNPTVGSLFTHDKITWKIRHWYGGAVVDFRGAYKAVVA